MKSPLILFAALCAAGCARDKSPFDMWDMRAGMPFERLDSIAIHDQRERFTCLPSYGSYRQCTLRPRGVTSRMDAVVDSTNRVVMISFRPDVARMGDSEGAGTIVETERLKRRWTLVVPPKTDSSQVPNRWEMTWRSKDRKYTSRIVWEGSIYPTEVATIDEEHSRTYRKLRMDAEADSIVRETRRSLDIAPQGGEDQLKTAEAELSRLLAAQDAHFARAHKYAATLEQLHFIPNDSVELTINGASESGWYATAKHSAVRGRACVIWSGAPPITSNIRLGGTARQPECGGANL